MKRSRKTGLLFLCIFLVGLLIGFAMSGCGSGRTAAPAASVSQSDGALSVQESSAEESLVLIEGPESSGSEMLQDSSEWTQIPEESEESPEVPQTLEETSQEDAAESEEQENLPEDPESEAPEPAEEEPASSEPEKIREGEFYFSAEDVAAYLNTYGKLPPNYLTKQKAQDLGWVASKGNLWKVTDHGVIGGDRFGNYEGQLPKKKNRKYYECDVNYDGGHRGAERLIYSSDGLIYYTGDHYETFTLLYGEE